MSAVTEFPLEQGPVLPLGIPEPDEAIFAQIQTCFVEALGVEPEEVTLNAKVIDDLGAESLDFLDIAYRLEQTFKVKIPRGEIKSKSQEGLDGQAWEEDGILTEVALVKLREAMPEIDSGEIRPGLAAKDIAQLFTVETFYNIVIELISAR